MKIVCLDGYTAIFSNLNLDSFNHYEDFHYYDRTNSDKVIERCKDADIIITNKVPLGKAEIDQLPKLKYITVLATGYNVIDTKYAKEKGILVSNVPAYSTKSVAQHTFAFILEVFSKLTSHCDSVRNGDWTKSKDFCYILSPLEDLAGKTIGIIGYGSIGREVSKIAKAFSMKVKTLKRNRPYETDPEVDFTDMDDLLHSSDIVSIHCPATPETIGMINEEFLSKMKKNAILINMARGIVANEEHVAEALNNDAIGAYCTDVICKEPMPADCPLLKAKNCFITPHLAWAYNDSRKRLLEITRDNIDAFINGKPINIVN